MNSKLRIPLCWKDPAFISQVKGFLASGMSDTPRNVFLKTGVDIADTAFWNKGLDEIEELLISTERLAKKLKVV